MSESAVMALPTFATSARLAREHVAVLVGDGASFGQLGVAAVIVSELVTNAVVYGRELIRLHLEIDEQFLRVGVFDGASNASAVAPGHEPIGEGGRGLRIVEALALYWGVVAEEVGKTVWATVALRST